MRPHLLPRALLLLALVASSTTRAQQVEGVDVSRARERAAAMAGENDAFAREVRRRAEAVRADAEATRNGALANRRRLRVPVAPGKNEGAGVDLDAILAQAAAIDQGGKDRRPQFLAFASMSMPPAALRQMIRDVSRAGGFIVFRGFPGNSVKRFGLGLSRVVDRGQSTSAIGIDPRLFRAFRVDAVPAYVVASTDFELCDGFRCVSELPPHDRMIGNVTPAYALTTFVEGKGPGAAAARVYLKRLNAGEGGR